MNKIVGTFIAGAVFTLGTMAAHKAVEVSHRIRQHQKFKAQVKAAQTK